MKRISSSALCALLFAGALFTGCSESDEAGNGNPTDPGPGGPAANRTVDVTYTYTRSGGSITLTRAPEISISCDGSMPVYDTVAGGSDTYDYLLRDDTLAVTPIFVDSLASGAVVHFTAVFERVGGGNGLEGYWAMRRVIHKVAVGTLTAIEDAEARIQAEEMTLEEAIRDSFELAVTPTEIIFYGRVKEFAREFESEWEENGAPDRYNVGVVATDDSTVVLTGNVTGEAVTIVSGLDENVHYTSSVAAHEEHTYYEHPVACPNEDRPSWYWTFLSDNSL